MQKYGPRVGLEQFSADAYHRQTMCAAMAADPETPEEIEAAPKYLEIANHAQEQRALILARTAQIGEADDLLTAAKALERVRKLRTKRAYEQARRDLGARAAKIFRLILPESPSDLGELGIKRMISVVEARLASLRGPDTPESVRTDHAPVIERHLAKMREADLVEDDASASLSALRASIVLFKAAQQREREIAYGMLVALVGKTDADEYFLDVRRRKVEDDDDEGGGGGPAAG
jgi:hypothetical protein